MMITNSQGSRLRNMGYIRLCNTWDLPVSEMTAAQYYTIIFWISTGILFYTYAGYGALLFLFMNRKKQLPALTSDELPPVTIVVAAYNEEEVIVEKIRNTLAVNYPQDRLQVLFITDGSTDDTPKLVEGFTNIRLMHQPVRQGKAAALNRAMTEVTTPFVVFTDANTLINPDSLTKIMRHYADPKVGGVAGEKKIFHHQESSAVETGEGIYWKYESFHKKLDAQFYSVIGAAGELFSIRTELYPRLPENTIVDDFMISLHICLEGYRMEYEPEAYATESASASMREEAKRKIRISAGSFQAMSRLRPLLNPFHRPRLFIQYLSRRVFRWTLCPVLLLTCFFSNLLLVSHGSFYGAVFILQCLFYFMAGIGALLANKNVRIKIFYLPYYFVFMNLATFLGFLRYIRGHQSAMWEKALRKKIA
jgi:biofilm PGA synthesis N-glycosyltransferase PgaC